MNDKKKIFPEVFCTISSSVSKNEKYQYYYPVVLKCIENKMEGKKTVDFFVKLQSQRIVLYAVNELSKYLCQDLKDYPEDVYVMYICDQNMERYSTGVYSKPVYGSSRLYRDYHKGKVDKIVVCNLLYENEIVEEFLSNGIRLEDIILFPSIIYYL